MTGLGPLLRKELLEQWRTRRLLVVAIVFLIMGIGSPFLARYTAELVQALGGVSFDIEFPTPTVGDAIDQFLKNVGQAGILTAILISMGSVATEKERGTAALILSKPASRGAYLVAKLAGISATLAVSLVLASAAAYFYTTLLFESPNLLGWAGMTALLLLALVAYAALTFLGSTLTRSSIAAAGFGIAGLVGVGLISTLPNVSPYTPAGISGTPAMALALGTDAGGLIGPVLVNLGIVAGLAIVSWAVFRRQEL
jgi:ABC-2 type transport system permease protein